MAVAARLAVVRPPLCSRPSALLPRADVIAVSACLRVADQFLSTQLQQSVLAPSRIDADAAPFCPLFASHGSARPSLSRRSISSSRLKARAFAQGGDTNGGAAVVMADTGVPATSGTRVATVARKTKETDVTVTIDIDGTGQCDSNTGIPFLDHMMDQLASHGLFDVTVHAVGDLHIDDHHTNEDIGLAMGSALSQSLGDRKGIRRFGDFCAPLDEALIHVVLDLSGRPHLSFDVAMPSERVGSYDTQLVEHFFQSMVNTSGMTLHIRKLAGTNTHHIIEATFKAFARALRVATEVDPRRAGTVPSSKGVLSQS